MGLLFLAFTLIPFVELYLLIRIGKVVGTLPTLGFVIVMGLLGAFLAKSQGRRVLDEWRAAFGEGRIPEEGVLGGVLVLLGSVLLITPGVITDVAGLVMLLPFTRRYLASALRRALEHQVQSGKVRVERFGFGMPQTHVGPFSPMMGHAPRQRAEQRTVSHRRPSGAPRPSQGPTEVGRGPGLGTREVVETDGEEVDRQSEP